MKKIIVAIEYQEAYAARDIKPIDVFNAMTNFAPHKIIGVYELQQNAQQSVHPTCGDSAPLESESTPEADTPAEVLPTPPTSG